MDIRTIILGVGILYPAIGFVGAIISQIVWNNTIKPNKGMIDLMNGWQILLVMFVFPGQFLRQLWLAWRGVYNSNILPIMPNTTPISFGSWYMFTGLAPTLGQLEKIVQVAIDDQEDYPMPQLLPQDRLISMVKYRAIKLIDAMVFGPLNLVLYVLYIPILVVLIAVVLIMAVALKSTFTDEPPNMTNY